MASLENVINTYLKEAQQPLVSNPPYVGDQLKNKESVDFSRLKTTPHFLSRMKERKIDKSQIKDVLDNGKSQLQNSKGVKEFTNDKIKVVVDIPNHRLVTVMHLNEKAAYIYDAVSDIDNFVCASLDKVALLPPNLWKSLLGQIEFLSMFYQSCHWKSKGDNGFQTHLLFERLYNEASGLIDPTAEHAVGDHDDSVVNMESRLEELKTMFKDISFDISLSDNKDMIKKSLVLVKGTIKLLEDLDKNQNKLSSGERNLLNDMQDKLENHVYLLSQASR